LVAEELLDDTEVRAALEQVGREAVPEGVGRDVLFDPGSLRGLLYDTLNGTGGKMSPGTVPGK